MHLDEERLQRLLHGELSRSDEEGAREHLSQCDECHRRFAEAEREGEEVGVLLRALDHPAPRVDIGAIARRAEERRPRVARWAAGVALVLGLAGVAYALPGSPVPRWVDAVVEWVGGQRNPLSPPASRVEPPDRSLAGIAMPPGENLLILFESSEGNGKVRVSLTEGAEVEVRAPLGAATFTSGEDRLVVTDQGTAATYDVQIPRAAPRVEIRVNESRIFLKEGARVTTAAAPGTSGPYLLPMGPSGR